MAYFSRANVDRANRLIFVCAASAPRPPEVGVSLVTFGYRFQFPLIAVFLSTPYEFVDISLGLEALVLYQVGK
jgi:hypothetical protein